MSAVEPIQLIADVTPTKSPGDGCTVDSAREIPVLPGDVIAGRYVIESILGAGGMGVVYLARHVELEHAVAIKFLRPAFAHRETIVARFLEEARAAAGLRSEHVVRVTDVGQLPHGIPYFVMEHLDGVDLETLLEQDGALGVELAVDYVLQACEALREVHGAGIVHRDIKPENLVLTRVGANKSILKIVDFGIAKRFDSARALTGPEDHMGSPSYMSPEQMSAAHAVDQRTDVWSLGVVFFRLLTKKLPFDGVTFMEVCARVLNAEASTPSEAGGAVDETIDRIVARCLEKDLEKRFQSVDALAEALEAWKRGERDEVVVEEIVDEPVVLSQKQPARRRSKFKVAALATFAAALGAFYGANREAVDASSQRSLANVESALSGVPHVDGSVRYLRSLTDGWLTAAPLGETSPVGGSEPLRILQSYPVEPSGLASQTADDFLVAEPEQEAVDRAADAARGDASALARRVLAYKAYLQSRSGKSAREALDDATPSGDKAATLEASPLATAAAVMQRKPD